jgi:hypothetical protein
MFRDITVMLQCEHAVTAVQSVMSSYLLCHTQLSSQCASLLITALLHELDSACCRASITIYNCTLTVHPEL